MPRPLEVLLALAATALAIAFFASVPYWPKEWTEKRALPEAPAPARLLNGPSVLATLPSARQPTRLELPDEVASVVSRISVNGETGLISNAAAITVFRLRAGGDLVAVSTPPGLDPVRPARGDPDPVHRVRGWYAVVTFERGSTVVRWTENAVTYEASSRTLDPSRLVEVANKLRG